MKILVTKFIKEDNCHEATLFNTDERKSIKIDFFVGCALYIPDTYSDEEYENIKKGLIGSTFDLKDDAYMSKGIYLPSEYDLN